VCAFQQGREAPSHYTCQDLPALVARINWCEQRGDSVYIAIASYQAAEGIYFAEVKRFKKRCHANIRAIKSLIIEIDTQESKLNARYKDRQEAYEALVVFCKQAGTSLPTVVSSGGGLHCWWARLAIPARCR